MPFMDVDLATCPSGLEFLREFLHLQLHLVYFISWFWHPRLRRNPDILKYSYLLLIRQRF